MTRFLSVAWLLVALPAFAGAQNRVTNGSFDVDLAGWDFPDATPVWTAFDIANSPESGSALVTNASTMADSIVVVLRECLPITKAGRYDSGTIINVPDTIPPMTSILVQVRLEKTPADRMFQAYIDDVSLVYHGIFDDSFESLQP
jgi:hypothetical protein